MNNVHTTEIIERKKLLKKLFVGIYVLNLLDALLMYILVKCNMNYGITLFMEPIAAKPLLLAFIKVGLVLYLFSLIYKRVENAKLQNYRVATLLFTLVLGVFGIIVWLETVIFGAWVMVN